MAKELPQNYSYANNADNELLHVSKAQRIVKYYCPICGEIMTPHMGKVRRWHFVHKNTGDCSYESYLHQLAKIKIRQAFLSSETFELSYKAKAICSAQCPFVGYPKCEADTPVTVDLRKYYDKCEIEAGYNGFIADLLLSSSSNPKLPPVMIEILVTHKCTQDKIGSGIRIIEIPIQSEEQIDNLVNNFRINAEREGNVRYDFSKEKKITLYNFNKVTSYDPTGTFDDLAQYYDRKNTIVFWLNQQGRFCRFDCHCYEVFKKLPINVHCFVTERAIPFKEIFQEFSNRGVKIRNCFLCRFHQSHSWGDRVCVLYKKHGLPRTPSPYNAIRCPHYREDILTSPEDKSWWLDNFKFYYYVCKDIL